MLLLTILTLCLGTTAKAAVYEEDFNSMSAADFKRSYAMTDDAKTWYVIGGTIDANGNGSYTISSSNKRGQSGKGIGTSEGANTAFLVTPKMQGMIVFYVARYSKYAGSVNVYEATEDGDTFTKGTDVKATKTYAQVSSFRGDDRVWEQVSVDCGEGMRLAIVMSRAMMDDFAGMEYEQIIVTDKAQLVVKDDITTLVTGYPIDFGLTAVNSVKQLQLTNPGKAAHNVSVVAENGVEATLSETALAAETGMSTLTITLKSTTTNGKVTIHSDAEDVEDFVLNVTGVVKEDGKMFVDFADGMPEEWATTGIGQYYADNYAWDVTDGYAVSKASDANWAGALTTTEMRFDDNELLMFDAQRGTGYMAPSLTIQYSAEGSEWQDAAAAFTDMTTTEWKTYQVNIPATAKFIRFYGWNVRLDNIYGGTLLPIAAKPKLAVYDEEGTLIANGGKLSWGYTPIAAGIEKTIILKNEGRADLSVAISNNNDYTLSATEAMIKAGEDFSLKIGTPAHDSSADAALTITPAEESGLEPYVISLLSNYDAPVAVMAIDKQEISFGSVMDNATETVTVSNSGNGTLVATIANDNAERFAVSAETITVEPGQSGTFTVGYQYAEGVYGRFTANIKVTPNDGAAVTIVAIANAKNPNAWSEDFEEGIPADWTNDGWEIQTKNDSKAAYVAFKDKYLVTPFLTAKQNEELTFEYIAHNMGSTLVAEYATKAEPDNWLKIDATKEGYTESATITFTAPAAGDYHLRFSGDGVALDNFYGFNIDQNAPALTVTPAEAADFGTVKAADKRTYTIKNTGTGTLEGTISSSDETQFTVSVKEFSVPQGQTLDFDIQLVFDETFGEKTATIVITPSNEGLQPYSIEAKAITADPNIWTEDFADGIPASWTNEGWTVDTDGRAAAKQSEGYLTTPRLKAVKDQVLSFNFTGQYALLKVEYAADINAEEWTLAGTYGSADSYTEETLVTFQAPADGHYYLRFSGSGSHLDNFEGFRLDVPAVQLAITGSSLPMFGKQHELYEASVTVANKGTEAQTVVARLFVADQQVDEQEASIAAGEETAVSLSYTPADYSETELAVRAEISVKDNTTYPTHKVEGVIKSIAAKETLLGDINLDDKVNGSDIQAIINLIVDEEYLKEADINDDGKVNGSDIQAIINIIIQE